MAVRISSQPAKFNTYILRTNKYLKVVVVPTNGIRLGWVLQNSTDWDTKTQAWVILYALYSDPLTHTSDIVKQVKAFIKNFRNFAKPLLNQVAASVNAIVTDGTVFNVVLVRKNPTRPVDAITAICNALVEMLGGAKIKFKCRTLTDAKRSALAAGADGVERAWLIGDKDTTVPDADSIVQRTTSSKATFIASLGTINSGKILYIYFRWINSKYPELAGPWSELQILRIP